MLTSPSIVHSELKTPFDPVNGSKNGTININKAADIGA